jgi:hypothetical protein
VKAGSEDAAVGRGSAPTYSFLVRCWREPQRGRSAKLRGTVCDLSGTPLGAFETEKGLCAVLQGLLAKDTPPGDCYERGTGT